jgi:hypothetical protein
VLEQIDFLVVAVSCIRWTNVVNVVKEHCKLLEDMQSAIHEEHFINARRTCTET